MSMTQQIQKPKINTKIDIVNILKNFAPEGAKPNPESVVKTVLENVPLSAETESKSKRQIILEGMEHIRALAHSENIVPEPSRINGKTVKPARIAGLCDLKFPIDEDIENTLGATRSGLDIVWNIPSGKYVYNIFEHQLKREDNA
jgi:hypothetical protein